MRSVWTRDHGAWGTVVAVTAAVLITGCRFDPRGIAPDGQDAGSATCGDGVVEAGEACDDGNTQAADGCDDSCQVEAGWVCNGAPSQCEFLCGNSTLDPGELCDGALLGGATCETVPGGFTGGTLQCSGLCEYDTTGCILPGCGNGEVGPGEACDDGNQSNEDDCLNNCQLASCGDGYVWAGHEECDDGNALNTDDCVTGCVLATCGDGFPWAGHEDCDDGNTVDTDDCLSDCTAPSCGDGFVWAGHEDCDDGNAVDTDDCLSDCSIPSCGDGFVWAGHEDCDDGNTDNHDGCLNDCTAAACGDGHIWAGNEACDDGNTSGTDGCSAGCMVEPYFGCAGEPSQCRCTVYVNQASPTITPTGASWQNATTSLATGLSTAATQSLSAGGTCDVWVAQGIYTTTLGLGLPSGITVYGGFVGNETARGQRDIATHVTVVDGQGSADSVVYAQNADNAGLDGVTLRNGLGSGWGGGFWTNSQGSFLSNCTIEANHANDDGGGVAARYGSSLTISRCRIVGNTSSHNGAGLVVMMGSTVEVRDSLFYNNDANGLGGAIWVDELASTLTLTNCTVVDNVATNGGGAARVDNGSLTVINAILWNNGTGALSTNSATVSVTYTQIQGGHAGAGNDGTAPQFVNPGADNYELGSTSPCLDSANGDVASPRDLLGRPRVDDPAPNNGTGTPAYVDRGAFERQ